jgi:stearoyl-CoA desaturase (delta-9 desaturase)
LDLLILTAMYIPTALGITAGYHRMLAHRAFETYRPVKYLLTVLGTMAVQGPVLEWVSDHRKHHAYADREGDPHSPYVGYRGALRGFWHSHVGWVFRTQGEADPDFYSRDLLDDRGIVLIDKATGLFVLLSFAIPFAIGYSTGSLRAGLMGLFWGGFARIALTHHFSFSVNSICHMFGSRPFKISDNSGNVFWLAVPTLGESWHHNHHAFPASAFHGLTWWQMDVSAWVIRLLRAVGLAWNVVEVSPEQQKRRAVSVHV